MNKQPKGAIIMRQTVPSHPEIARQFSHWLALIFCFAIVFFSQNSLNATSLTDHKGDLVIDFTFVPADVTVPCNFVPAPETPAAQDNCPGEITINLSETSNQTFDGGCNQFTYNITRTWTATNGCGESASVSQTIEVLDSREPVLSSLPADVTLFQADGATIPVNDVTAFDDCDGNPDLEFLEGIGSGGCTQSIGRTWIATDACGNAVSHSQQITFILDWFLIPEITPQTCDQLGSVSISANNGSSQLDAVWQDFPGNTTPFQGGLAAGDYFLFIIDQENGCKEEITITIPFDCNPTSNCAANAGTITANGGGQPCQQNAGDPVNLSATPNGNMVVPNGFLATYVLTQGADLIIADIQTTPSFNVTNTGNYIIHTLVYDPNTINPNDVLFGSGFTVNSLLIQGGGEICGSLDVGGAVFTVSQCEVVGPNCVEPIVDNIVIVESTCNNSVGSINITMTTPNTDFTFSWDPAVSSSNAASNIASGVYTVRIASNVDPNCTITETIVVGNSDGPQPQVISTVPANCSDNGGQVVLGPNNLMFNWGTSGVATENAGERINLFGGNYQVTVTDPANPSCITIIDVEVEEANNINGGFIVGAQPTGGQANGAVIVTTEGGALYNYKWSDGVQTLDPNRFDLLEQVYTVTICDTQDDGCDDIVIIPLTADNPNCNASITLSSNLISIGCIGDTNATVDFTIDFPTGCIEPRTTQIIDEAGNVVANGTLTAGNYCVVLTEGNGAIAASECFEVVESSQIVLDIQPTNATCFSGGSILLEVTGGSFPYTYAWSDFDTNEDRTNLRPGMNGTNFMVTVTDASGCQAVSPPIFVMDTCEEVLCNNPTVNDVVVVESNCGESSGFVEIGLFEDIANYTFTWAPDMGVANAANNSRTGVPAGSYTVTIVDNNDPTCGSSVTAVVGNTNGPDAALIGVFPATCTESNGTATILPESFNYTWSHDGGSGNTRNDLPEGIYQVTVVDPAGDPNCINVLEVVVNSITPIVVNLNIVDEPDCGQANGLVIVGAFGGTNNYTYAWSDGFVNPDPMQPGTHPDLAAGSYCVTVTDVGNLGCVEELCFVLLNRVADDACANINMAADTIFTSCIGAGDANANFTTDFCPNFQLPGTTEIFKDGNIVANGSLSPGEHCIVISDGAGCLVGESCFTVLDREKIDLDIEITPISCITGGIINVIASGGAGGYSFNWDPVFPDVSRISNLDLGSYSLTVTDVNGCSSSASNLTITNACAACDPFFATDELEIEVDCDMGGELCLDIAPTNFQNILIEDNFMAYQGVVSGCNFDSTFTYPPTAIPGGGIAGPYTITEWRVVLDGMEFTFGPQGFNTIDDLVMQMNAWDPSGNWIFNTTTFNIEGGNSSNEYGTIFIEQDGVIGSEGQLVVSISTTPLGTGLTFDEGPHTLVLSDTLTGCSDTLDLSVICDRIMITRDTLLDTIMISGGGLGELCADTTELPGNIISTENFCEDNSGINVDFFYDSLTFCVTYDGLSIGTDPYCLVLCDDQGFCDTTLFIVTVEPGDGPPPMLRPDTANTVKNAPLVISVAENDMNENWTNFEIVTQPNNGEAEVNEMSETATYSPDPDFCGTDQFTYSFSNENGIDTATVFMDVSCECLVIYDGFSPNEDGTNDVWIIEGIDSFENNEVCVFNRWGNQVFRKEGYTNANPFDGSWEGDDLPDGTYFYVIDLGDSGETFTGILQINR